MLSRWPPWPKRVFKVVISGKFCTLVFWYIHILSVHQVTYQLMAALPFIFVPSLPCNDLEPSFRCARPCPTERWRWWLCSPKPPTLTRRRSRSTSSPPPSRHGINVGKSVLFCISKTKSHWNVKTINISKKWQNVQFSLPTQIYVVVISHLNVQYLRSIWNFSIWQICSTLKFERYALRDTKIIFETVNNLPIFCLIPELLFQYQQFWQSIHHLTSSLLNILGNPRPLAASSLVGTTHTFPRKVFWCRL